MLTFLRLVNESRRQQTFARLSALEIYSVDTIVIRRFVKINGRPIYGRDLDGKVILKAEDSPPTIFYSRSRTRAGDVPLGGVLKEFAEAFYIPGHHKDLANDILTTKGEAAAYLENELELAGCGRSADVGGEEPAAKPSTGFKVLDASKPQKKPLLNTSTSKVTKIGYNTRSGNGAGQATPECHSNLNGHAYSEDYHFTPSSLPDSSNGYSRGARTKPIASGRTGGASAYHAPGNHVDTRMDLSSMHAQLNEAMTLQNEQSTGYSPQSSATEVELAIGRAGEHFVSETAEFLRISANIF